MDDFNTVYIISSKKDNQIEELFKKVLSATQVLEEDDINLQDKYKCILSIEYLLFRIRIIVETEHIQVKRILSDQITPASLKTHFTKRDVYLSQVTMKLQAIQSDITNIQKLQYNYQLK